MWMPENRGEVLRSARSSITFTLAPRTLDVMGGIADYSGALVLEMPIAAATWVAAQPARTGGRDRSDGIHADGGSAGVGVSSLAEIVPSAR
jgi:L-arabinokinase